MDRPKRDRLIRSPMVARRLRAIREAWGWSQSDLAREAGITRTQVAWWEAERCGEAARLTLVKMLTALSTTVDVLYGSKSALSEPTSATSLRRRRATGEIV